MMHTHLGGRPTSRLGFGCGRLVGGAAQRQSIALVETALNLGIRHFDVAPSYGMGLAEDVIGTALAGRKDVTIATKVGIGRPGAAGAKALARQILKPALAKFPGLRAKLAGQVKGGARGLFEPAQIEASLAESLRRLRLDCVDALMLHQPQPDDVNPQLLATMTGLVERGLATVVGSSTSGGVEDLVAFGQVAQCQLDLASASGVTPAQTTIFHGLLRRYPRPPRLSMEQEALLRDLGRDPADPDAWTGLLLSTGLALFPDTILLISSTNQARLQAAAKAVDWTFVAAADRESLSRVQALFMTA